MKTSFPNTRNTVLLARENVYFGGMNLSYQLHAFTYGEICTYFVRVERDGEMCEAKLGSNLSKALKNYQIIVRGGVTPCALDDVLHYM